MNKSKGELIAIRVSEEERGILEEKAKEQCMSVSQYIRYKSLLEEELNKKAINDSYAIEYLNKNVKMITRAIIETWINVKELSSNEFDNTKVAQIKHFTLETFDKLGIRGQSFSLCKLDYFCH